MNIQFKKKPRIIRGFLIFINEIFSLNYPCNKDKTDCLDALA